MFIRYCYTAPPLHFLIPFSRLRVSALLLTRLVKIAHHIHNDVVQTPAAAIHAHPDAAPGGAAGGQRTRRMCR